MLPCSSIKSLTSKRECKVQTEINKLPCDIITEATFYLCFVISYNNFFRFIRIDCCVTCIACSIIEVVRFSTSIWVNTSILIAIVAIIRFTYFMDTNTTDNLIFFTINLSKFIMVMSEVQHCCPCKVLCLEVVTLNSYFITSIT